MLQVLILFPHSRPDPVLGVSVAKRRPTQKNVLAAWRERNPLLVWRLAQPPEGWNRSLLARQLGVSHTAVRAWETGASLPVVDAFAKIEKLTGINSVRWMEWFEQKPKD